MRSHKNEKRRNSKYRGRTTKKKSRNLENQEIEEKSVLCQEKTNTDEIHSFEDFPVSFRTVKGLTSAGYTKPTEIQKDGISLALRGLDVLGAAKTGSGKTLAFLVPVIELLWRNKWGDSDGLGALIISPTRELALQTFEVLRKIGKHHDFSAGLVIGGKDLDEEQKRIRTTNILICTPGRLLQHFDETPNFQCLDLKILVLDEADRILDLGFAHTMNAIIENLPTQRQTLLYSATQTKSVRDLARLSLNKPEYIAVHENSKYSTPKKLVQSYAVINLQDKINFLFSFVKNHLKTKSIVFFSSCKQVKFMYEVFRKIRPGVPLLALYGKQKQLKRIGVYTRFCNMQHALLFATDIAARGLDFPAVNWVIQFDCPEDADTYIHRAGRTARYEKGGQALLLLIPAETNMVKVWKLSILKNLDDDDNLLKLEEKKIPIHEIKANPKKLHTINGKLQAFCAQNQEIKHWAQKSIISYARSVYLQKDKTVFDVKKLPLEEFSESCGLLAAPRIRFMKKLLKKIGPDDDMRMKSKESNLKNKKLGIEMLAGHSSSSGSESEADNEGKNGTEKENFKIEAGEKNDSDSEDDLLVKKTDRQIHETMDDKQKDLRRRVVQVVRPKNVEKTHKRLLMDVMDLQVESPVQNVKRTKSLTKTTLAKKVLRKKIKVNTKIIFDEDGEVMETKEEQEPNLDDVDISSAHGGIDVEKAKVHMREEDKKDRALERKRIKEKHKSIKKKEREERKSKSSYHAVAVLDAPVLGNADDETVYSESDEEEGFEPPNKRFYEEEEKNEASLMEDEQLALHLLGVA